MAAIFSILNKMINSKGLLPLFLSLFLSNAAFSSELLHIDGFRSLSNGKGTTLTINANNRSLVLRKPNGTLRIFYSGASTIQSFVTTNQKFSYTLNVKTTHGKTVAGLAREKNVVLYSTVCDPESQIQRVSKNIEIINSFVNKNQDSEAEITLLDSTCNSGLNPIDQKFLKNKAQKLIKADSLLVRCLNDKNSMSKLAKLPDGPGSLDLIVNELMDSSSLFAKGQSPFTISCEEVSPPASFNAKFLDNKITIPISGRKISKNQCSPLDVTLAHEMIHKSGVRDEKIVSAIQDICIDVIMPEIKEIAECKRNSECVGNCHGLATQEVVADTLKIVEDQNQKQVVETINQDLSKKSIQEIKVSESDWKTLEENGDSSGSSRITRSIASSMSNNFDKMAGTVNKAVALVESPALASSSGSLAKSSSNSASRKTNSSTEEKYYTTKEYLADKFPVVESRKVASVANGAVEAVPPSAGVQPQQANTNSANTGEVQGTSTDLASSVNGRSGSSSGLPSVARKNIAIQNNRAVASTTASDSITVLQRQEVVSGADYTRIKNLYNSPSFKRELVSQGIAISLKEDGVNIGVTPSRATLKLIDNGTSIRRLGAK